jgi:hypothetical protein
MTEALVYDARGAAVARQDANGNLSTAVSTTRLAAGSPARMRTASSWPAYMAMLAE